MKKCELCGEMKADSIAANVKGEWKIVCPCSNESPYFYWIMKGDLDTDQKLNEWVEHLSKKNWFYRDAFMVAYRELFK